MEGEPMLSHMMVGSDDIIASRTFYDAVLGVLGIAPAIADSKGRLIYTQGNFLFMVSRPIDGLPATHANGGTIGFAASSPELVDEWHATGIKHGGTPIENPPGIRENAILRLYLAYLRDPAGNKLCATHRMFR
jgi:catechol 2,3-dioxygenase-like lactoylglutathione lyase family enzyme